MQTLLIVDDDPLVLKSLDLTLQREGYRVLTAQNGEEAIALLKQNAVAVIICDQRLPNLSGVDVLKQAQEIQPEAIRIILTGHGDLETVLQAINVGKVSQFLMKPWDDLQLKQTLATACERYRLSKENLDLHSLIVQQHQTLAKTHDTLKHELLLGARIHETLLLGKVPRAVPGFSIKAMTIPSKEIDGDFFEFYRPSPLMLDVVIGDVMGKGIPAALVGTALKTQLMRFAVPFTHSKVWDRHSSWEEDLLQPHEILEHVHAEIVPQLQQLDYFSSVFYGRFHLSRQTFTFVDCGSTKPIHYSADKKRAVPLKGQNCPLGSLEQNTYSQDEISYGPGDLFIFYSDGLTETQSPQHEFYGFDRLIAIAQEHPDVEAAELLACIKASVVAFANKEHFDDDLTILVIKILKTDHPLSLQPTVAKFRADLSQLRAVRAFIDRHCRQAPGDRTSLSEQLQLAINEAFCNIAKHGYREPRKASQETPDSVAIQLFYDEEGITVELSDQGRTYDPATLKEPSLAGDLENGFGWPIIRAIADRVSYLPKESENGWNHLRLFKRYIRQGKIMQFAQSTQNNVLIITPEGDSLDAQVAPEFKEKMIDLLAHDEHKHVIFDLHALHFIDSSGLGTFLSVLRTLHRKGGELKLACMNKPVRTMFELVSMHKIFEIFNSTDEAVRSFK